MIKHLLIPLDGSSLAESVLPAAASLAKRLKTDITLIHIIEKDPPETVHGQRHLTSAKQAKNYLNSIEALDILNGIKTEIHVHEESVKNIPLSIAEHTNELHQDLIVMCTHGSSGLHGMIFGSIAQQVISFGKKPVMLINPAQKKTKNDCSFSNFLIPLDGNPEHEQAVNYATWLAKRCNAGLHLLVAIPQFGNMSGRFTASNRFLPGTTSKMMDMIVPDAIEYLENLEKKIAQPGIEISTIISRENPANAIEDSAKKIKADLIILATHGTKGAEAFLEGSVTPKISKSSKIPLLLVPVVK